MTKLHPSKTGSLFNCLLFTGVRVADVDAGPSLPDLSHLGLFDGSALGRLLLQTPAAAVLPMGAGRR